MERFVLFSYKTTLLTAVRLRCDGAFFSFNTKDPWRKTWCSGAVGSLRRVQFPNVQSHGHAHGLANGHAHGHAHGDAMPMPMAMPIDMSLDMSVGTPTSKRIGMSMDMPVGLNHGTEPIEIQYKESIGINSEPTR